MAGQYGTEQLEKISADVANVLNNAFRGGLVGGLGILSSLSDLKDVDFTMAAQEVKELDAEDRAKVEAKFKAALDLSNKTIEAKIEAGISLLDDGFVLVAEVVEAYRDVLSLIAKVKVLVA